MVETDFIINIILTGIGAGIFAGMFGIGGGIVILPALMLFFRWTYPEATGTSLAALLLPTNFYALYNYKRNGMLYLRGAAFLSLGMLAGCYFGADSTLRISESIMKELFGVFQICMGIKYIKPLFAYKVLIAKIKGVPAPPEPYQELSEAESIPFYYFIIIGLLSGMSAGLFGIGGGVIITTALISIFKIPTKNAVALSLSAMFLPTGIFGVMKFYNAGNVHITAAILIAVGIEVGSNFSSRLAVKMNADFFKRLFGIVLIISGLYFIIREFVL
ncbi:MAG: sulfite exporter TauE/SafE family protein [Ignavibacteria bacterium]|nr:sulfite exporter TauE/SafE family protein [Ignavibacteria bacterium]